jgi:hypothetical protein|tara:strand:+ start:812 stop:1063 length:252 start_codon:yes stop_codon:yes gene_type:complete
MDKELIKISDSMQKIEELVRHEIKSPDEYMLVCSALMAVTRNMYASALGPHDASRMFKVVSESFAVVEDFLGRFKREEKPTIH